MKTDLSRLKNLGTTTIQWLNAIGIRDACQLQAVRAVDAYCLIQKRGFSTSLTTLYCLQGALTNTQHFQLSAAIKKELVSLANQRAATNEFAKT